MYLSSSRPIKDTRATKEEEKKEEEEEEEERGGEEKKHSRWYLRYNSQGFSLVSDTYMCLHTHTGAPVHTQRTEGVGQRQCLPSLHEGLGSTPSTWEKNKSSVTIFMSILLHL